MESMSREGREEGGRGGEGGEGFDVEREHLREVGRGREEGKGKVLENVPSRAICRRRITTEAMMPYSKPASTLYKTVTKKVKIMIRKSTGATHSALRRVEGRGGRDLVSTQDGQDRKK